VKSRRERNKEKSCLPSFFLTGGKEKGSGEEIGMKKKVSLGLFCPYTPSRREGSRFPEKKEEGGKGERTFPAASLRFFLFTFP